MRAAIYARYSNAELQRQSSIVDQVRSCRDLAARLNCEVVATYADSGISGAHLESRPEALRLLADAKRGAFDVVIAEALDRLSRDQEHTAAIFKRLTFAGVRIVTVAEGEINELHVGLRGTMNSMFLKDLGLRVRRGQEGRARAGRIPAGNAYGYDVIHELDHRGEPVRGKRKINEAQAEVIRRIFRDYVSGISPRAIAAALNREGVPSPSRKGWNASTINGSKSRHNGILQNPLYTGRLVWNRLRMVKDPETGRRISRLNPESQWIVVDAPELRIVPPDLWEAAQTRKARYANLAVRHQVRPKHLLSGLLRCGVCGGAYVVRDGKRLGCSAHREKGTCTNNRTVTLADAEARVLEAIRARLLAPEYVAEYVREYHEERKRLAQAADARRAAITKRLAEIARAQDKIIDHVIADTVTEAHNRRMAQLEEERKALAAELEAMGSRSRVVELHPGIVENYRRAVENLQEALAADQEGNAETIALIRSLLDEITVEPLPERGQTRLVLKGQLAKILSLAQSKPGEAHMLTKVVAAEGFEPPTKGL